MSAKRLTEDDKQEILKLYRETPATTSTLSAEFGVSSSTISRHLKNNLSSEEYESLIQQKRLGRTPRGRKTEKSPEITDQQTSLELYLKATDSDKTTDTESIPILLKKDPTTKEIAKEQADTTATPRVIKKEQESEPTVIAAKEQIEEKIAEEPKKERPILRKTSEALSPPDISLPDESLDDEEDEDEKLDMASVGEMLGEDIADDEEDEEEWDEEGEIEEEYEPSLPQNTDIKILPLADADFPRTCYLVIDRMAELITCPLREFTHLGKIPDEEVSQRTLPIFDNHRVARRFSKRSQRVIKVPDGKIFEKTYPYLADKGITRLLLDGQIYALPK
ncbi:MAG: ArsR family transcriptional regulator [Microcystaceae cyanobacterium]